MSEGNRSAEALADCRLSGDTRRRGHTQGEVVSLRLKYISPADRWDPDGLIAGLCVQ